MPVGITFIQANAFRVGEQSGVVEKVFNRVKEHKDDSTLYARQVQPAVPILFPISLDEFWKQIRSIIQEEVNNNLNKSKNVDSSEFETTGLTYKPLYKIADCAGYFRLPGRPFITG